jgi:hypothetical protein
MGLKTHHFVAPTTFSGEDSDSWNCPCRKVFSLKYLA